MGDSTTHLVSNHHLYHLLAFVLHIFLGLPRVILAQNGVDLALPQQLSLRAQRTELQEGLQREQTDLQGNGVVRYTSLPRPEQCAS